MMGLIQDSNFDCCGTNVNSQSIIHCIIHMVKTPFLLIKMYL